MEKKERMLNHITKNVKWFLSTNTSVEIIPYYNMSYEVFSRANECLVSGYVEFEDVVCLVSTSVLEPGKSGILFTTDAMYCKSWGLFTTKYKNYYFSYEYAEFDFHNDFYEDRMKEMMEDLNDISIDEDENEIYIKKFNEIIDKGKKIGEVALGSMALIDILSTIGDNLVSQNNEEIANQIAGMENANNQENVAIMIYEDFIPLVNRFIRVCEMAAEEGDDISDETYYAGISALNDVLMELYLQTEDYIDVSLDDEEEYTEYVNWIQFWALMFYDDVQFNEIYQIEELEEAPEIWDEIINFMDGMIEDDWEELFSNKVYDFATTVINNSCEILELLADSDWDDEFEDRMNEIVESNCQAVKSLRDVLDRATDYLYDLLPDE